MVVDVHVCMKETEQERSFVEAEGKRKKEREREKKIGLSYSERCTSGHSVSQMNRKHTRPFRAERERKPADRKLLQ